MKKTLSHLLGGLLLLWSSYAFAQNGTGKISGKVLEPEGAPVSFANVALYKAADSSLAKVEFTDAAGVFHLSGIPDGEYYLEITYVGLPPLRQNGITLVAGQSLDLQTLRMLSATAELEEVLVIAQRPILEMKTDRMVLNVENTINAAGNTALELLRKAPGVVVDNNDNVTLLGRPGVRIFIDGKPSPLRGEDLANHLRTMQSTEIESIEIITNPSSRYDADGNAGIINIKLKKDKNLGANANVTLGYSVGERARYNTSINGNYRNRHYNAFGSYTFNDGANTNFLVINQRQLGFKFDQLTNMNFDWRGHNFKAGLDYFLNKKHTLGVMVDGNVNNHVWSSFGNTLIGREAADGIDSILAASSRMDGARQNLNFNGNYRFDDGKGQTLNVDLDAGLFRAQREALQPNRYLDPSGQILLDERIYRNATPTDIDIYTFKLDYERPFAKGKLGAGFKVAWVQTDNTFDFFNVIDGQPILDIDRSNNFVYLENVNAAYLNYARQLKKLNFQLGLRAEHTGSTGTLTSFKPTGNDEVKRDYLDLFPSASLSYALNQKHNFQLSYSRRINRPSYQNLNPFENKINELTYEKGNPFLQPEYSNNVQLTHSFNYRLNTTLSYSHTRNLITQQTDTAGTNASFITFLNLADQYNYSLSVGAPIPLAKWWNTYTNLTAYYRENQGDFGEGKTIDLSVKAFNIFSQQTFQLPKGFTLELSGWYNSPSIWGGAFEMNSQWSVDFGVQKKLLQNRGNLKLSVSDIFKTTNWSGFSIFGVQRQNIRGGWDSRRFQLNFSYLLGNAQVKGAPRRKAGLEEEQRRINTGN
jgi:iron complex outermembrane receptor protein